MTDRKPPGVTFESWVDRQIREAAERGAFDDLPGAGRPLAHEGRPYHEMWWVREKLEREGLSFLPPSLVLRNELREALDAARLAPTEALLRRRLAELNSRIDAALRRPIEGPPLGVAPVDVEAELAEWRRSRS
ncbi:DnaJ family domain-containing protein [Kitasatospora sp. NPDC004531]